jgi:radical SAM superfamily enzyme YgiQ (UPF0313 family)
MTPSEHDLQYFEMADLDGEPILLEQLGGFDLVAISSYSAQIYEAYQLAEMVRKKNVPVAMGGLHVSMLPMEAKNHCDTVIIGEGELSWLQVIKDLEQGRLQPFYGDNGSEFDLTDAPMPAFELLDIDKYNRLTLQTSRGCAHRCEFCASSVLLTNRYKQKPAEKVLAEIDKIKSLWTHPFIELADDNSFVNKHYWKQLLPELATRKIRWFTETDLSISRDIELLRMLRESGCAQVLIGFESVSRAALNGLEMKRNWKASQAYGYKEAIATIQSYGISVNGCFILGLDEHDSAVFDQIYEFVLESGLHEVQITIQTAFPGTPLYRRLKAENRILEDRAWQKCTLFDINFHPRNMSVEQLSSGFKQLSSRLYSDECTRHRRSRFKSQLREIVKDKVAA